jgi:hypothetical protein
VQLVCAHEEWAAEYEREERSRSIRRAAFFKLAIYMSDEAFA